MPRHWSHQYHTQVTICYTPLWGYTRHLSVERCDGKPIRCGWDTLQRIKDEALGEDVCAIEFFPEEREVVNEVNRRHFWEVPPGFIPVGLHFR